jgi:hypothetical protein
MEIVLMKSPNFNEIIAQENVPGRGGPGTDSEELASELQGA